jgi:hypothetical protein
MHYVRRDRSTLNSPAKQLDHGAQPPPSLLPCTQYTSPHNDHSSYVATAAERKSPIPDSSNNVGGDHITTAFQNISSSQPLNHHQQQSNNTTTITTITTPFIYPAASSSTSSNLGSSPTPVIPVLKNISPPRTVLPCEGVQCHVVSTQPVVVATSTTATPPAALSSRPFPSSPSPVVPVTMSTGNVASTTEPCSTSSIPRLNGSNNNSKGTGTKLCSCKCVFALREQ